MAWRCMRDRGTFKRSERGYLNEDLRAYGGDRYGSSRGGPVCPPRSIHFCEQDVLAYRQPTAGFRLPGKCWRLKASKPSDLGDDRDYWPERAPRGFVRPRSTDVDRCLQRARSEIVEFSHYAQTRVTRSSPYWIDGLTNASSYYMSYSYFLNNEGAGAVDAATRPTERALTYLDLVYDLNDNWQLSLNYTLGDNETCGRCGRPEHQLADRIYGLFGPVQPVPPGTAGVVRPRVLTIDQQAEPRIGQARGRYLRPAGWPGTTRVRR